MIRPHSGNNTAMIKQAFYFTGGGTSYCTKQHPLKHSLGNLISFIRNKLFILGANTFFAAHKFVGLP